MKGALSESYVTAPSLETIARYYAAGITHNNPFWREQALQCAKKFGYGQYQMIAEARRWRR